MMKFLVGFLFAFIMLYNGIYFWTLIKRIKFNHK